MNIILFSLCILGIKGIGHSEQKYIKLDTTTMMIGIIGLTQVSIVLIILITCTYLLESCKTMTKVHDIKTIEITSVWETFVTSLIQVPKIIFCMLMFLLKSWCKYQILLLLRSNTWVNDYVHLDFKLYFCCCKIQCVNNIYF